MINRKMSIEKIDKLPLHVLIAEDNKINQKLLTGIIKKAGLSVTIASNGIEVVALLPQHTFDLIILDYHMPHMNGLEVLKLIRGHAEDHVKNIPVFMFTSEKDENNLKAITELGVDRFLGKPINQKEILGILNIFGKIQLSDELTTQSSSFMYLYKITNGNTKLIIELIDVFIEEAPEAILKLKLFIEQRNFKAVHNIAHKLGTNYNYVGAEEAAYILKDLVHSFGVEEDLNVYRYRINFLEEITLAVIDKLVKEKSILISKNS